MPAVMFANERARNHAVWVVRTAVSAMPAVRRAALGDPDTGTWRSPRLLGQTMKGPIRIEADIDSSRIRLRLQAPDGLVPGDPFVPAGSVFIASLEGADINDSAKVVNFVDAATGAAQALMLGVGLPNPPDNEMMVLALSNALDFVESRHSARFSHEHALTMFAALMPLNDNERQPAPESFPGASDAMSLASRITLVVDELGRSRGVYDRDDHLSLMESALKTVDGLTAQLAPGARTVAGNTSAPAHIRLQALQGLHLAHEVSGRLNHALATFNFDEGPRRGPGL